MKNLIVCSIAVCMFALFSAFTTTEGAKIITVDNIVVTDFCDGWKEGYKEALAGCMKIGMAPMCPIPPIGKDSYKHGYGMGYAKAQRKCN
tara:strand:- start:70 stop:339 length:270 start_codon:yes stop_codon:yes gene_type:complete